MAKAGRFMLFLIIFLIHLVLFFLWIAMFIQVSIIEISIAFSSSLNGRQRRSGLKRVGEVAKVWPANLKMLYHQTMEDDFDFDDKEPPLGKVGVLKMWLAFLWQITTSLAFYLMLYGLYLLITDFDYSIISIKLHHFVDQFINYARTI